MKTYYWALIVSGVTLLGVALLYLRPLEVNVVIPPSPPVNAVKKPEPKSELIVTFDAASYVLDKNESLKISVVSFKPLEKCIVSKEFLNHASLEWWWRDQPVPEKLRKSSRTGRLLGNGYDRNPEPMPREFVFSINPALKDQEGKVYPGFYDVELVIPTDTEVIRSEPITIHIFQSEAERAQAVVKAASPGGE